MGILRDSYTSLGFGNTREKTYNRATHNTRKIAYGMRPSLDSDPKLMITPVDDTDVLSRPWDAPSEIQRVSKMVEISLTWPRLTTLELAYFVTMALSNKIKLTNGTLTKIACTPFNAADSLDLFSSCMTVNYQRSKDPALDSATFDPSSTVPDPQDATIDPGIIRAYDGFFVNSVEISLERSPERLFTCTVEGYASGAYTESESFEGQDNKFHTNASYAAAAEAAAKASFVDARVINRPVSPYLRGTDVGVWISAGPDPVTSLALFSAKNARRLTAAAEFTDRALSKATPVILEPTDGDRRSLANTAYNFRWMWNNNVNIEDLSRWGAGDNLTAAERQTATSELQMEFDFDGFEYLDRLYNDHDLAFQIACEHSTGQGFNLMIPKMRLSEVTQGRQGVKRTQQLTFRDIGQEAGSAPVYADFVMPTTQLVGADLLPVDTGADSTLITDRE